MFTGLVDHVGIITDIRQLKTGVELDIQTQFNHLTDGESIAVDGACLTVMHSHPSSFTVQLSEETLNLTIAKNYQSGSKVNLERSLKMGDALGGHFVSGHVDETAEVFKIIPQDEFVHCIVRGFSKDNENYLIHKGSICLNGVSLTINKFDQDGCHLMLIPHTLQKTNLTLLTQNTQVNIEYDLLAKHIARQMRGMTHDSTI